MITAELTQQLSTPISRLLENVQTAGFVVLDLGGRIKASNDYAKKYLGAGEGERLDFVSLLEDGSGCPSLVPHMNEVKILRIQKLNGGTLIAKCSFVFEQAEGVVLVLPLATGSVDGMNVMSKMNDELSALTRTLSQKNSELEEARQEIRTLSGLLPICSYCKKIKRGDDTWEPVEAYVRDRTDAEFSHGYCPDCFARVMRELEEQD
jgi:hypothetical protein